MKQISLFVLAAVCCIKAYSQDTLYTNTGEVIQAKVVEIDPDHIKYKKPSNPDGPLYTINRSDIVLIHYKNGSKDVFSTPQNGSDNNIANNNGQTNNGNQGYDQRPRVNIVFGSVPFFNFRSYGWGHRGYGYYRPHRHHHHSGRRGRRW